MDGKRMNKQLAAYAALYGDSSHLKDLPKPSLKSFNRRKRQRIEHEEQSKFCCWMTKQGILFYAIPNQGRRNHAELHYLVNEGLRAGVPDLCVPIPSKGYGALYIEMKRPDGGIVSDRQAYWIAELTKKGNLAKVCYSFDEAKKVVCDYLSL